MIVYRKKEKNLPYQVIGKNLFIKSKEVQS